MFDSSQLPDGSFGPVKSRYLSTPAGKVLVIPGLPRQLTKLVTLAQANAGFELLPALLNFGYRYVDFSCIAIGGSTAGGTSLDLLATKGGSASRAVVQAVAGLAQDVLLRMGASNSAILAGGASYTVNDKNTNVSLTKQSGGSALTTATGFQVNLIYVVE